MHAGFTRALSILLLSLMVYSPLSACNNCDRKRAVTALEKQLEQLKEDGAAAVEVENIEAQLAAAKKLVVVGRRTVTGYDGISREFYDFMDGSWIQITGPPLDVKTVAERLTPFVKYSAQTLKPGDPKWGTFDEDGNWLWYYRELEEHEVLSPNKIAKGRLPKWFIAEKEKARLHLAGKKPTKVAQVTPQPKVTPEVTPPQPRENTKEDWIKELGLTTRRPSRFAREGDGHWGVWLEENWMWYRQRTNDPLIPPVINSPKAFKRYYSRGVGSGAPVGAAPPR